MSANSAERSQARRAAGQVAEPDELVEGRLWAAYQLDLRAAGSFAGPTSDIREALRRMGRWFGQSRY